MYSTLKNRASKCLDILCPNVYIPICSSPLGVLLMTVSSDGVDGRPADAVQRKLHSRGQAENPGDITILAPSGS